MEIQADSIEVKKQVWKNHISGEEYSDPLGILYYQNLLKDEKYSNLLLGNFNSEGNYSIDKELLQELINVNKYITDNIEGVYHLIAKTQESEFDLHFLLKIKNDEENNKKIAALVLIEPFTSVDGQNNQELNIVVARYRDENDIYFMPKVAKVFHIFDKRDENGREEENETILLNTLKLKKQMKLLNSKLSDSNEYLSQYYIDNVLAILKKNPGKYSEYILRKYQILLEEQKSNINKKNYYKLLRLELDKLLNSAKHICDNPDLLKELNEQKQIFVENLNKFEETIISPVAAAPKKEEAKKPAAKKAAASAPKKAVAKKKAAVKKAGAAKKKAAQEPFKWIAKQATSTLQPIVLKHNHTEVQAEAPEQANKQPIVPQDLFLEDITQLNIEETQMQNVKVADEAKQDIKDNITLPETNKIQTLKDMGLEL